MSRTPDIRVDLVNAYSRLTINELAKAVNLINAVIDAATLSGKDDTNHMVTFGTGIRHEIFNITLGENKLNILKKSYSTASVQEFGKSLELMAGPMGLGERTFSTLYSPVHNDLKSMGLADREIALIIASAYSGIMKRWHNRNRAGSDNDYRFKLRFEGIDRPVTFTIKGLSFIGDTKAKFFLECNQQNFNDLLNWEHEVYIPTPAAASMIVSEKISSTNWVQEKTVVTQPNTFAGMVAAFTRHCKVVKSNVDTRNIEQYLASFLHVLAYSDDYFVQSHTVNWVCDIGTFVAVDPSDVGGTLSTQIGFVPTDSVYRFDVKVGDVEVLMGEANYLGNTHVIPQNGDRDYVPFKSMLDILAVKHNLEIIKYHPIFRQEILSLASTELKAMGDYSMGHVHSHWFEFNVVGIRDDGDLSLSLRVDTPNDVESIYFQHPVLLSNLREFAGYKEPGVKEEPAKKQTVFEKIKSFFKF